MVDGHYEVQYFHPSNGYCGCGQVRLLAGKISGSDAGYMWSGSYSFDGTSFSGELIARTETPNAMNVFGDFDDIVLTLQGSIVEADIHFLGMRNGDAANQLHGLLKKIVV